jgi:hypothetical protein
MLAFIETLLPTFIAIMSLAFFTKQTRKLCYANVSLCVLAELIPLTINSATLAACSACLCCMVVLDFLQSHHYLKISTLLKHKEATASKL